LACDAGQDPDEAVLPTHDAGHDAKSSPPPPTKSASRLSKPPAIKPHGPEVNGLTLGMWSEQDTYELNGQMDVWIELRNNNRTASGGYVPYDMSIHDTECLAIRDSSGNLTKVQGCFAPGDGMLGCGYTGSVGETVRVSSRPIVPHPCSPKGTHLCAGKGTHP
jgi:hypothetical protein